MKITINRNAEEVQLVRAMASKDRNVAADAQLAMAEFIGPVLAQVINNAPTLSNLFTTLSFDPDDNPSIPLGLYYDITDEDYINVWSQSIAGGLPQNIVQPTHSEMKISTYTIDSAIAFDKKHAAKSRLDVVSKSFTRLAQEIMLKQERSSANMIMTTLALASTGGSALTNKHVFRTAAANRFVLEDLNKLFTKIKRINTSWAGGTPSGARRGLTDLIVSPEIIEEIRAMAYNPINTKEAPGLGASSNRTAGNAPVLVTESVRNQIFSQAGIPEFYGVSIMEILELGVGAKFNDVFDVVAGSNEFLGHAGGAGAAFDGAAEEVIIGMDRSRDSMLKAAVLNSENGSEFSLSVDDQYTIRQGKIGYFGGLEEGRIIVDNRVLVGLIC